MTKQEFLEICSSECAECADPKRWSFAALHPMTESVVPVATYWWWHYPRLYETSGPLEEPRLHPVRCQASKHWEKLIKGVYKITP